jgi:hypothetical protein
MGVKWTKTGRNASNNGVMYENNDFGPGVGKLVYDGGLTIFFVKGHDYDNEEDAIQASKDLSDAKVTKNGRKFEVVYTTKSGGRSIGPIEVRAKSIDEAAKKGFASLKEYDPRLRPGHLTITDDKGAAHEYDLSEKK